MTIIKVIRSKTSFCHRGPCVRVFRLTRKDFFALLSQSIEAPMPLCKYSQFEYIVLLRACILLEKMHAPDRRVTPSRRSSCFLILQYGRVRALWVRIDPTPIRSLQSILRKSTNQKRMWRSRHHHLQIHCILVTDGSQLHLTLLLHIPTHHPRQPTYLPIHIQLQHRLPPCAIQ